MRGAGARHRIAYRLCRPLALLAVCFALFACAKAPDPKHPPNVVLITLDTLRADHMSLYGYERDTTPFLKEFAKTADVFTRCYATSPWTLPTHASIFTGLFPYEHGARQYLGEKPLVLYPPVPEELNMLTEILKEAGYNTISYAANEAILVPRHGFDRGFDLFRTQWRTSEAMNNYVRRGMKPYLKQKAPFFLFINYMDAHIPYNAEPIPGFLDTDPAQDSVEIQQALFKMVVGKSSEIPKEKLQVLTDQYDTAIRHLDAALQNLTAWMKDAGIYDNTLIIITSDHGEFLGEHDMLGHVYELYQDVLHVPLIVKFPSQAEGKIIAEPASSVDIPGMVLDTVSVELAEKHKGQFKYRVGEHPVIAECYYGDSEAIYDAPWAERFMITQSAYWQWPWKLIVDSNEVKQLYDLEKDPGETDNLNEKEASRSAAMAQKLNDWLQTLPRHTPKLEGLPDLNDTEREALENLGYL